MAPYVSYYSGPLCRGCDHPAHEYACETSELVSLKPRRWEDCKCEERA